MELLGYSQTLFGFLGAILMISIIAGEGNFLFNIIQKIEEDIKKQINNLFRTPAIEKVKQDYDDNAQKILLTQILNDETKFVTSSVDKSKGKENKLKLKHDIESKYTRWKADFYLMVMRHKAQINEWRTVTSSKLMEGSNSLTDKLQNSREQSISPLYMLLYCFIIFLADITVNTYGHLDVAISILLIFTLLTILFFISIWTNFLLCVNQIIKNDGNDTDTQSVKTEADDKEKAPKTEEDKKPNIYVNCLKEAAIILLIYTSIALVLPFCPLYPWISTVVLYTSLISIIGYFDFRHLKNHKKFGDYKYRFVFAHFAILLIMSITAYAIARGIAWLYHDPSLYLLEMPTTNYWTQMLFVSVITIFGFVLPMYMRYKAIKKIKTHIQADVEGANTKINDEYNSMITEINTLYEEIAIVFPFSQLAGNQLFGPVEESK